MLLAPVSVGASEADGLPCVLGVRLSGPAVPRRPLGGQLSLEKGLCFCG